jgi:hypothetical protein
VLRSSKMRQWELLLIVRFLVGGTCLSAGATEAQTPDRMLAFDSEVQSQNFSIGTVFVRTGIPDGAGRGGPLGIFFRTARVKTCMTDSSIKGEV